MNEELEDELTKFEQEHLVSEKEIRGKLIRWVVRNLITVLLYVYFWHIPWVKYTLFVTVPLAIIGLVMIFGYNRMIERRVEKTRAKIANTLEEE